MSIWGDADADEIPDDPFRIEPNWYPAIAIECFEKDENGTSQLTFKWKIKASGSRFDGLPVPDKNNFYKKPNNELTGEEIQRNSFLKMKLRQGFDLGPDEIKNFTPKMALGKEAMIEVTNNPDKSNPSIIYNNVRGVLSRSNYEERFGASTTDDMPMDGGSMLDEM